MEKNNLMNFQIVGKSMTDKEWKILHLTSTGKGWMQICDDKSYINDYVSNETIHELLEWFKCDFFQYRMFEDLEEAKAYLNDRKNVNTQK